MDNRYTDQINKLWPKNLGLKLSAKDLAACRLQIKKLLIEKNAVLITHYYVDKEIQQLTEETGGIVADSLEMARFAVKHPATLLLISGVRFMGETAKILSPNKKVLMADMYSECSLDISCQADDFAAFCKNYPERKIVVYANTSAAVKAQADWVVTSSIALDVIDYLDSIGEKLIWAPDRHLGRYLQQKTGADMILWNGACIVHEEFKAASIHQLKAQYPDAAVLVHPESPYDVIELADVIGSTSQLLKASQTLPHSKFIVATDNGIFYKMQQASPHKIFIEAPTGGNGATCRSCAHCPWMGMNNLQKVLETLKLEKNEVVLADEIAKKALIPLQKMLTFSA